NANLVQATMNITGTGADINNGTGFSVLINNTNFGTNQGSFGSWNFSNSSILDGKYSANITVTDAAGHSNSSVVTFTIDDTNPLVTNAALNRTNATNATQVRINVTVADSVAGVAVVIVGNSTNQTMTSIGSDVYQLNTTLGSLGCLGNITTCKLTFFTNDTLNNRNQTTTLSIGIVTTSPAITLTAPQQNSLHATKLVNITGTASDTSNSTGSITINDSANFGTNNGTFGSWNFTNTTGGPADGKYSLSVTATNDGSATNSTIATFTIDTTAPTPTLTPSSTSITTGDSVTITCSATDNIDSSPTLTLNVTNPGSTTVSYTCGTSFTSTDDAGTYTIGLKATDDAGNSAYTTSNFTATAQASGGGGGGATTGPDVTKTFSKIDPGAAVSLSITKQGLDVSNIEISVTNAARSITIEVTKLAGEPATVTRTVESTGSGRPVKAYQFLEIKAKNLQAAAGATAKIDFKVPIASWLQANNIDKTTVKLKRYVNGDWEALPTSLVSEDANYVYYKADSPGFSTFAITGEQVVAQAPLPALSIVSPATSQAITGDSVTITLSATNINLVAPLSAPNAADQGHFHVWLDNDVANYQASEQASFTFTGVQPGQHTVTAELHQNDHSAFSPNIAQAVGFTIEAAAPPQEIESIEEQQKKAYSGLVFVVVSVIVIAIIIAVVYFYTKKRTKPKKIVNIVGKK
ncbi:MAG: PGF-pre-PGF domain-containing protein, partial [Candidatus Aenigmarchaeota archaeon]|nr:PGF-pre-PGF domain-containing protein [Candidatus Aenigmarchaeota archaeon]